MCARMAFVIYLPGYVLKDVLNLLWWTLRRRARPPSLSPPSPSLLILTHRGSQLGVTGALTPANQTAREVFPDMPL
ncbi:hypothetical protein ROHU_005507 [Labeo rohita]|uniref:Uncharacterized protein n=1 Tax=Labeo rohita TaxID=84645 RepID=A0A498NBU5_LABRO|nr:hypothetical protein ROHU_005507 [Labeo rohita]